MRLRVNGRIADGAFSSAGYRFALPLAAEDRAQITAGRAFLDAGGKLFGFLPPWGCITGLRPPSAPAISLARGNSEDRVRALFADDYLVSPAKTELTMRTAARETALLADISPTAAGCMCRSRSVRHAAPTVRSCLTATESCLRSSPTIWISCSATSAKTADLISSLGLRLSAVYIGGGTPLDFWTLRRRSGCFPRSPTAPNAFGVPGIHL